MDMTTTKDIAPQTKCCECHRTLDAVSADYAARYPDYFRTGILGACCQPLKASADARIASYGDEGDEGDF